MMEDKHELSTFPMNHNRKRFMHHQYTHIYKILIFKTGKILNTYRSRNKQDTNFSVISSVDFDRTFLEISLHGVFCSDQSNTEGTASFFGVLLTGVHLKSSFLKCLEHTTLELVICKTEMQIFYLIIICIFQRCLTRTNTIKKLF